MDGFTNLDYILLGVVVLLGILDTIMSILRYKPSPNNEAVDTTHLLPEEASHTDVIETAKREDTD